MAELFNLLDDGERADLYIGSTNERQQKLANLKQKLRTVREEVQSLQQEQNQQQQPRQ